MTDPQVVVQAPAAKAAGSMSVISKKPAITLSQADQAQLQNTFETLSKNILALPATFARDSSGAISTITFGNGELVKTLQRSASGAVSAVILTGSKLGKYELTKTLLRSANGALTGYVYSQRELP